MWKECLWDPSKENEIEQNIWNNNSTNNLTWQDNSLNCPANNETKTNSGEMIEET